jgi:hypothetical protein
VVERLTAEVKIIQRVQKGDSSMVRALRVLQKLMAQPDPSAIFAEFDSDGDKQVHSSIAIHLCLAAPPLLLLLLLPLPLPLLRSPPACLPLNCQRYMALCLQIDRDELRAGFLKLGEHLTEDDIDAIMVRKHALFFCATFALKSISLPRQARDKHRKS